MTTSPSPSSPLKGPGSPLGAGASTGGGVAVEEMVERLTQTDQLVSQLKEMIREKDMVLRAKDDQLKVSTTPPPGLTLVNMCAGLRGSVSVTIDMLYHRKMSISSMKSLLKPNF